jgi:hypothetical protein
VGEGGHQQRADGVGEVPPLGGGGGGSVLDVHLDGGRRAHHRAACEALDVEEGFHGLVTGPVEDALGGPERVETPGHRLEPFSAELGRDGGEVGAGGGERPVQAGQRPGADLNLAAGFEGDAAAGRKGGPPGDRLQLGGRRAEARVGGGIGQKFELDTHEAPVRRGQAPLGDVPAQDVDVEVAP